MNKELRQALNKRRDLEKEAERAREHYAAICIQHKILENSVYPDEDTLYEFYHECRMEVHRIGYEMLERWNRVLDCSNYISILLEKRKK